MHLSPDEKATLSADMGSGERTLWTGRPHPVTAMRSDGVTVLFACVWLLIVGTGAASALHARPLIDQLLALPFLGAGLYLLATPLRTYARARGTFYAITNRRLVIASRGGRSIRSLRRDGIRQVERVRRGDRTTLRIPTGLVGDGDSGGKLDYTELHGIADSERAYRLLTEPVD